MPETLKIVIPMAGWGTRMRPQTWSKPKPLVTVAGKTVLDHLLDTFRSLPDSIKAEYTFIVSPFLGEDQIPIFMQEHYPYLKVNYRTQREMKGQSHALLQAGEFLYGPIIVIYADTLIRANFSSLANETVDIIGWTKSVLDPRRFGVAVLNQSGLVDYLVEKPESMENNLAVVGCYYFREGRVLLSAIEEQIRRDTQIKGEYFLTDAINIMLEYGSKMRIQPVESWLDTGTVDATLETNRYLLENGGANNPESANRKDVKIIPPVFIHKSAEVVNSVIGPNASIGAECIIKNVCVENSILDAGATVESVALKNSFIGRQSEVRGHSKNDPPLILNVGDQSSVTMG
jgi:glucose-1-phosphate thymidylyltransferase